MNDEIPRSWKVIADCFASPTLKQKEAYGRFCHTLAVAAVVGFLTIIHVENEITVYIFTRAVALFLVTFLLFVIGAIFSKGE